MTGTGNRYTEEEINEIVYRNEDAIIEEIREYIVDNISLEGVGDIEYDGRDFFENTDTKFLFNLDSEELYEYIDGTDMGDYFRGLVQSGKIVSVYDLNMKELAAYIENEIIWQDEENRGFMEKYRNRELTKEEYFGEIEMLIYDRYIEEYISGARLTVEEVNIV